MNRLLFAAIQVAALAFSSGALAGDLNPPVGPVAPTQKPLAEVEPRTAINAANTPGDADSLFIITQPGSYYLTGDITGVVSCNGILISASDVTIDLMGFTLRGVPGSSSGMTTASSQRNHIRIENGVIRDWGVHGIDLAQGQSHHVIRLHCAGNDVDGIRCADNAIIESCTAFANGAVGIRALGFNAVVRSCTAHQNSGNGIALGGNGTVSDCSSFANLGSGIMTGLGAAVTGCSARSNTLTGIATATGCTVSMCSALFNGADGINTGFGCTISNNSVVSNVGDGIHVIGNCTVIQNTCNGNGNGAGNSAGIYVASSGDNRVEANNCTGNDRGIDVDTTGNIIIRNTCSGNTTNYDIVAINVCLVVSASTSAAIVGNSGGVSPGSTDPNANFSY